MAGSSSVAVDSSLISGSSNITQDTSDDAFFVNRNDIHGNPLVSEVLTGRQNFVPWRKAMEIALSARDKLEFVEGVIAMPTDPKQKARWKRRNNVIMTWILNSVSKNVVGQILHSENVAVAWKSLNMKYGGSNVSRKFSLQQEIANLMQGDMDVSSYHEKLVNLWHERQSFYDLEKEEGRVIKFLMGLNESFTHIRTHIIALRELPSLDVAYDMVVSNESERAIAKVVCIEASAMYVHHDSTYKQQAQSQNSRGNATGKVKQRPYCTYCQLNGHTKEHCYKLNGYPPGHRLYKVKGYSNQKSAANVVTHGQSENGSKTTGNSTPAPPTAVGSSIPFTTEQVNQIWNMIKQQHQGTTDTGEGQCHIAGICSIVLHSLAKHSWIIDSGATDHFICDKNLLDNVYELPKKCHTSLPDGNTIVVSSAGTY
ncbi:unnamed protein product [Rhodiola kirilowii]